MGYTLKRGKNGIKGIANTNMTDFGANLAAQRASQRVTMSLLQKHKDYLANQKHRRQARADEAQIKRIVSKSVKPATAAQLNYRSQAA